MQYSVIHLNQMVYQQREVVKLEFSYSEELVKLVKKLPGARWDKLYRIWYIEKRAGLLNEVLNLFKGKAYLDYKTLKNEAILNALPLEVVYQQNKSSLVKKHITKKAFTTVKQYALSL